MFGYKVVDKVVKSSKVVKFAKVAHIHVTTVDALSLVDTEQSLRAGGSPLVEAC